jgi:hypothetical protein
VTPVAVALFSNVTQQKRTRNVASGFFYAGSNNYGSVEKQLMLLPGQKGDITYFSSGGCLTNDINVAQQQQKQQSLS